MTTATTTRTTPLAALEGSFTPGVEQGSVLEPGCRRHGSSTAAQALEGQVGDDIFEIFLSKKTRGVKCHDILFFR